jgi:hypothetical protein
MACKRRKRSDRNSVVKRLDSGMDVRALSQEHAVGMISRRSFSWQSLVPTSGGISFVMNARIGTGSPATALSVASTVVADLRMLLAMMPTTAITWSCEMS